MLDRDFEAGLDRYQATLAEEAAEAADRSYVAAARPDAVPLETTYDDLRVGDYMTNEGPAGRWVNVVDLRGPFCRVRARQQAVADGEVSVLFEIVESVAVSGETRYWIERPAGEGILVDASVR